MSLHNESLAGRIKDNNNATTGTRSVRAYLVVSPQPGQAIGVHDAEDFALWILPADVVFVPAVWQELVDIVPEQPAVCKDTTGKHGVSLH